VQGAERNTRDPSWQPSSGQSEPYKPKAKSAAAKRESEGIVVPAIAVKKNAAGGKGPWGDHVGGAGKREGMAARSGPNNPGGRRPRDKVRQLQRRLWASAKRAPGRRFHALYDHIGRSDVLAEAWRRVRANKGAAGVDGVTLAEVEEHGVERFLQELGAALRDQRYRAEVVRRRYIPKADGRKRPLGIPTVRDRVAQMAVKLILEPIFEADFLPVSFGFRPKRSALGALETLRKLGAKGHHHVLDADIRDYFGSIDHDKLMKLVAKRNLHVLDVLWTRHSAPIGKLVRYADDFVVMTRTKNECEQAEARIRVILARLGLELHPDKTRKVELRDGKAGFDFLGCHLHKRMSGRIWERDGRKLYFLHRWPSQRSMKRIRQRVKELTPSGRCHADLRDVISALNPVLRGWGNYFKTGNAAKRFNQLDGYVWKRLRNLRLRRKGRHLRPREAERWTRDYFWNLGLHRLRGTVQYPESVRC
jgi:RNA-directed DNA polymerase